MHIAIFKEFKHPEIFLGIVNKYDIKIVQSEKSSIFENSSEEMIDIAETNIKIFSVKGERDKVDMLVEDLLLLGCELEVYNPTFKYLFKGKNGKVRSFTTCMEDRVILNFKSKLR